MRFVVVFWASQFHVQQSAIQTQGVESHWLCFELNSLHACSMNRSWRFRLSVRNLNVTRSCHFGIPVYWNSIRKMSRVKKLTFRALALRKSEWRNCGLCVGSNRQLYNPLRWRIYIFNFVDITKLPCYPHRRTKHFDEYLKLRKAHRLQTLRSVFFINLP